MNDASHQGSLRALREAPFALLREMERRTRSGLPGGDSGAGAQAEWVGIGFQLANERFLVARDEIREVMMMPSGITRVPGAKDWVAGLANLRGQLLMVVDLRTFLGAGSSKGIRTARVLVADHAGSNVGFIVDEVFGFRRFSKNEFTGATPATDLRCERYLAGACARGSDVWPILSLSRLMETDEFRKAAA